MILGSSLVSAEEKNVKNLGQSSYNNVQLSCHQEKESVFNLFKGVLILDYKCQSWVRISNKRVFFPPSRQQHDMNLWMESKARQIQKKKSHKIFALEQLTNG